jgi:hypothetical protein
MIGLSPIGGNHDEVVSLGQVKQRRYALLATLAANGCEEQDRSAPHLSAHCAISEAVEGHIRP